MANLGISTLFSQKMGAETAESKSLSRTDSDSLLAVVSKNLEASLQQAFDIAGEFAGIEAPQIMVNRDFDLQVLDAGQITQYLSMWQVGAITHKTLLESLKLGEVLPHLNVEEEIELVEQEKIGNMEMAAEMGLPGPGESDEEDEEEEEANPEGDLRREVERRMRRLAGEDEG